MKKFSWFGVAVLAGSLCLCLITFFNVILPADTFHWDESHHALYSLWITQDIQHGDWDLFWKHTHHQTLWPFFYSWYEAAVFLLFGVSYVAARGSSLFLLFLTLLGIWYVGRGMRYGGRNEGEAVGIMAWGMAVTSRLFWIRGAENMLESMGALQTLLVFYFLLMLHKTKKWLWIIPLSVLMAISMVTKYNYAIFIYASVAVWALYELVSDIFDSGKEEIESKNKKKKKQGPSRAERMRGAVLGWGLKYFLVFLPSLCMFVWWMLGENRAAKWAMIVYSRETFVNTHHQVPGLVNNIIYYFNSLIFDYNWFTLVGIMVVLGIFGVFFLVKKWEPSLVMLVIFTWVSMLISIFIFHNKTPRYIYSFAPLIFLTSAYCWVSVWEILKERLSLSGKKIGVFLVLLLVLFSILLQGGSMADFFLQGRGSFMPRAVNGQKLTDVLDFFLSNTPENVPFACGGALNALSPYVLYFHSYGREVPKFGLHSLHLLRAVSGMHFFNLVLRPDSPYFKTIEEDSVRKWNDTINANRELLQLINAKDFNALGIRAEVYRIK